MQNKNLVSVIIVNWNGKNWLKYSLPTITNQDYKNIEVIVVDNNSSDGSIEYISKNFPNIQIILNQTNEGFANANNIGFSKASGEYILFLNNDTVVSKNLVKDLMLFFDKNINVGIVQPKIHLFDNTELLDSVGSFLTSSGFLYHFGVNKKNLNIYKKRTELYSVKGACMMAKTDCLNRASVGGEIFDSSYFAYFEETDLCHRVWLTGKSVLFYPKSLVLHKMGGTSEGMNNNFIQYHSYKNRINTYLKNLSFKKMVQLLPLHILLIIIFSITSLIRGNPGLFLAIHKAIIWNLINIKETIGKRNYIQKNIRVVSDDSFWKSIFKNPKISYYYHLFSSLKGYND